MSSVNPKLLIALAIVIAFAVFVKLNNPYRQYSTGEFWATATVSAVDEMPDEALKPGNKNGPVLMWAAMSVRDPKIISALVQRGADVNESDGNVFKGTPLTGAAGYSASPAIIDQLIQLGADVNHTVNNNEDALMIAAQYNRNPGIIERLVFHGTDMGRTNCPGHSALYLAIKNKNEVAREALERLMQNQR